MYSPSSAGTNLYSPFMSSTYSDSIPRFNHNEIPSKSKPTKSLSISTIPFTTLIMTPCLEISPLITIASLAFSSSVNVVWSSAADVASSTGLILITSNKYL